MRGFKEDQSYVFLNAFSCICFPNTIDREKTGVKMQIQKPYWKIRGVNYGGDNTGFIIRPIVGIIALSILNTDNTTNVSTIKKNSRI